LQFLEVYRRTVISIDHNYRKRVNVSIPSEKG
jgi:hypothetical protein